MVSKISDLDSGIFHLKKINNVERLQTDRVMVKKFTLFF